MDWTLLHPAAWGFAGAVPYAATRAVSAFWGSADVTATQRKAAIAHLLIAMFTGPATAAAVAPMIAAWSHASLSSVSFGAGLFCNAVWPILTSKGVLRPALAKVLSSLGGWAVALGEAVGSEADER